MQSRQTGDLLAVPEVAVQTEGDHRFIFVPQSDSSYEKRPVKTGQKIDGLVVITDGLAAGERIVTAGSFTLKAELLKSTMEGE
jgi:multidrug efflux pump subunit AcrA (membrane-fusion protein)